MSSQSPPAGKSVVAKLAKLAAGAGVAVLFVGTMVRAARARTEGPARSATSDKPRVGLTRSSVASGPALADMVIQSQRDIVNNMRQPDPNDPYR